MTLLINHQLGTWHCRVLRVPSGEGLPGGSGAVSEPRSCSAPALGLREEQSTAFVLVGVCGLLAGNVVPAGMVCLWGTGAFCLCVFPQGLLRSAEFSKSAAVDSATHLVCSFCLLSVATERVQHLLFIYSLLPQYSLLEVLARMMAGVGEASCLL